MKNPPALQLCELQPTGIPNVESFSPFCLKAHRALKLAGLPYSSIHASRPDAHRRYNPTGQVPVLLAAGRPIADSTNIVREIIRFAPGRIAESAEDWLYEELADTALNGFLIAARWADDDNWPRVRAAYFGDIPKLLGSVIPPIIRKKVIKSLIARDIWRAGPDACWSRFRTLLDHLDARAPASGYWMGAPIPGVADLAIFAQLHSLRTPLTPQQHGEVARRPKLSAWLDRVDRATLEPASDRPASPVVQPNATPN